MSLDFYCAERECPLPELLSEGDPEKWECDTCGLCSGDIDGEEE